MTDFPTRADITYEADEALGPWVAAILALYDAVKQMPGAALQTELTLAAGSVTPTQFAHTIDTEADAAADDLTHLAQDNLPDGFGVMIAAVDAARVVTVKHAAGGAGQINLVDDADLVLDDPEKWLWLKRSGTAWVEVKRCYGNDAAAARAFIGLANAAMTNQAQTYTKPQRIARDPSGNLSGTVTFDFGAKQDFKGTTTAAITIGNPNNLAAGQRGSIVVYNPGGYALSAMGSWWVRVDDATLPDISTTGTYRFDYDVVDATDSSEEIHYRCAKVG